MKIKRGFGEGYKSVVNCDGSLMHYFITGNGKYHSENHSRSPKPYGFMLPLVATGLMTNPLNVPKEDGAWAIFSTKPTRSSKEQYEKGMFCALWVDIDENKIEIEKLVGMVASELKADMFCYTTKSATKENIKCRIIIFLHDVVSGSDFVIYQKLLNDTLKRLGISVDRATENAGQICYLPNRGVYYRHAKVLDYGAFDPAGYYSDDLLRIKHEHEQSEVLRNEAYVNNNLGAVGLPIVDYYNNKVYLEKLLEHYGYLSRNNKWLSPNSEGGSPGLHVFECGKKWYSNHESDYRLGIGKKKDGKCFGDAFDLFMFYEHGGDFSAAINAVKDKMTLSDVEKLSTGKEVGADSLIAKGGGEFSDLRCFSLRGKSSKMKEKMLEDKYVLGKLAILGEITVFYAKPNSGKTLLTLWLLIEAIKKGDIEGRNVFYINADDSHKGLQVKTELAERHGFEIVAPSHEGFNAKDLVSHLSNMSRNDTARNKVIILDTVKKFTDVMDKKSSSEFLTSLREFSSKGGTCILLAHTNKHRNGEGKVIAGGTSDITDDSDCAYTLDVVDSTGPDRTVKFENTKNRGGNIECVTYSYLCDASNYYDLLESVTEVGKNEYDMIQRHNTIQYKLNENKSLILVIQSLIESGFVNKTKLVELAGQNGRVSKKVIMDTLKEHNGSSYNLGHRWIEEKGVNAAKTYKITR